MNAREKPTYAAIDVPAYVNGREALLAVRRDSDPEQRVVIAMFENEARWLHAEGRLMCWEHDGYGAGRQLAVELTSVRGNERADLTVDQARALREWLAEFIVTHDEEDT